jgi:Uma2 family endonuclease
MEHGEIAVALASELRGFVRPRRLGRVAGTDIGIVLECNPDTVREPDVAYFSAERLLLDVRVSGYVDVAPDILAEIISPRDRPAEVNSKTRMWLSYGVAIVWEIHPLEHEIMVHRSGMPTVTLTENDTLDGGEVLPGFTCPVREIFDF